jgi:hypothetical protein
MNNLIPQKDNQVERSTPPLLWTHTRKICQYRDFFVETQKSLLKGPHFGGKESFLLSLKSPMCGTIGWNIVL